MDNNDDDIIVIGAGPAGLSAAIYGARAGLKIKVIERGLPGGTAATTDIIENYPGFPEGIKGIELGEKMKVQALKFGAEIIGAEVKALSKVDQEIFVHTEGTEYKAKTVIIASGTVPKKLGVPGEEELRGRGISYCATCDGPLFKGRRIAVIGCGNSGLQEGAFLLNFVEHIIFVEFLPYITADKILQKRYKGESRVEFLLNHELISINGKERVASITVRERSTKEEQNYPVDGVFMYVGMTPLSNFLTGTVDLDNNGFVITNEKLETSVQGIFAAGDIRSKEIRQVITACAEGAIAAINAHHYLEKF